MALSAEVVSAKIVCRVAQPRVLAAEAAIAAARDQRMVKRKHGSVLPPLLAAAPPPARSWPCIPLGAPRSGDMARVGPPVARPSASSCASRRAATGVTQ
jgi:hypothetical protein